MDYTKFIELLKKQKNYITNKFVYGINKVEGMQCKLRTKVEYSLKDFDKLVSAIDNSDIVGGVVTFLSGKQLFFGRSAKPFVYKNKEGIDYVVVKLSKNDKMWLSKEKLKDLYFIRYTMKIDDESEKPDWNDL